jgi:hypothetical protein
MGGALALKPPPGPYRTFLETITRDGGNGIISYYHWEEY